MNILTNIENRDALGIDTGFSNKKTAGTDFTDVRKQEGYILDIEQSDKIETFSMPLITEIDGSVIVYSKDVNYKTTPFYNDDFKVTNVLELVNLYIRLKNSNIDLPLFSTNLFYKFDNKYLVMPPKLIEYINNRESLKSRDKNVSIFRFPEALNSEKSVIYSIGVMLFQATTGSYPFIYSDVEDLRDKMRRGKNLKPQWKNPKISEEMSNFIMELMDLECGLSLNAISEKLSAIINSGYEVNVKNQPELEKQYKFQENRLISGEKRRHFIKKYSGVLVISAIGLIVLGSIFGSIISSKLAPPATAGFTSEEVLDTYFQAFQTVNPELLDDVLHKGIRPNESDEISAIYVTNKMKQQYNNPQFATPQNWLELSDEDKKLIDVYGIYNLQIKNLGNNTFDVTYEKWFSEAVDNNGDVLEVEKGVFALTKREIFTLTETKYSYDITNIETLSQESRRVW